MCIKRGTCGSSDPGKIFIPVLQDAVSGICLSNPKFDSCSMLRKYMYMVGGSPKFPEYGREHVCITYRPVVSEYQTKLW